MPLNLTAKPPVAETKTWQESRHGTTRTDLYAWLRDPHWQDVLHAPEKLSADIRTYLEAENAYTAATTQPLAQLETDLFEAMRARVAEDEDSLPTRRGDWDYFTRTATGKQYRTYLRRKPGGADHILLDVNTAAEGHKFFKVNATAPSPNHAFWAYTVDLNGSESCTLRVLEAATGNPMVELHHVSSDIRSPRLAWAADSQTFFYVELDDQYRPWRVRRHTLDGDDAVVFTNPSPSTFVQIRTTLDGMYLVIALSGHGDNELYLLPTATPADTPKLFAPRVAGEEYQIEHHDGQFIIRTNTGDAFDFQIMACGVENTDRTNWQPLVAHQPGCFVLDMLVLRNHIVLHTLQQATQGFVIFHMPSGKTTQLAMPDPVYEMGLVDNFNFEAQSFRFDYQTPTQPLTTYDYTLATGEKTFVHQQAAPNFNPADYTLARIEATGHDGVKIPISLLYHNTTKLDGTAPLWLGGYGSYGLVIPQIFNVARLALVDRGFIYAWAHIRGGSDCGRQWYLNGKLAQKENTFRDFISAAEHLCAHAYTRPGRIVAEGRSAGGMLMGVVANWRPDLWGLVVAGVPFVDVLNTMCDATLPLTPPEWNEWGNPIANAADYHRMAAYSPYDNVTAQDYPPMLVLAGLTDPRVTYWEPAKWVAKLRATKTDSNPLLLKMEMSAGHMGASGRYDMIKDMAFTYAVAMACVHD